MSACENVLLKETNREGYSIAFLAKFEEQLPVSYIIRIIAPNGHKANYACGLKCFRNIGELLTALCYFAETELYLEDVAKLKKVLTAENLKNFAEILKTTKVDLDKKIE
jgi:hypothetical protein